MQVEKCENANVYGCPKCGRLMPDLCKDWQDMLDKAAAFDVIQASQTPADDPQSTKATLVDKDPKKGPGRPPKAP